MTSRPSQPHRPLPPVPPLQRPESVHTTPPAVAPDQSAPRTAGQGAARMRQSANPPRDASGNAVTGRPQSADSPKTARPAQRHPAKPARGRWFGLLPRWIRFTLQGAFALAFAGMMTLAIVFLLVQRGPISVSFLVGPIEEAIRRELGSARVEIASAFLRQSEDGRGIEFRLADLRIKDANGAVLAETPLAGINLSGAALLRGWLAPVSVEFIRPRLKLTMRPDGGLALAVSRPVDAGPPSTAPSDVAAMPPGPDRPRPLAAGADAPAPAPAKARQIDLIAALQSTFADFREGDAASAYLRELGLRDAALIIEHDGREIVWQIPSFRIDVQHFQKRSVVVGEGLIGSNAGPWGLSFRTVDSMKKKQIRIEAEIAELVPRALAGNLAFLPGLAALDMPVGGIAVFDVSPDGGLVSADLKVTLSPGNLMLPGAAPVAMAVAGGAVHLSYSGADRHIVVHPSELVWGRSRGSWSGHIEPVSDSPGIWRFDLASRNATIGGLPLTEAIVAGHLQPQSGHTRIDRLSLRAGEAHVAMSGGTIATPSGAGFQLDGSIGPLSLPDLIALWPGHVAPELSQWVKSSVQKGRISGGAVRLASQAGAGPAEGMLAGLSFDLDVQDLRITPMKDFVPVIADSARLRLAAGRLELAAPQARLPLPSGRQVALRDSRLTVPQLGGPEDTAELVLQSTGPASALMELIDQEPLALLKGVGLEPSMIEGRSEVAVRSIIPLANGLTLDDIKTEGRIRISEARSKSLPGGYDISGGSVLIGLSDKALDARGDVLVAGVPAKISWQRIFNTPPDRQPPARLTASLDAADRDTLGLSVNHMVQGDVPVVVTLQQDAQGQPLIQVEANLGAAELLLETMAWRKAPGRPAVLQASIVRSKDGRTEMPSFKIVGDDISLEGQVTLDARNHLRAFNFPAFAVNVMTKLEMQGRMRDDGVLEVKTKGTAYDGRAFFRSLFSAGQITDRVLPAPKHQPGLDLSVEIDTIVGFTDTNLKNVQFSLKRRGDKVVALQASGALSDSGVPVNAEIRMQNGTRMLHASSADAGSAFRLIGFYPNMRGGNGVLDVNLDGRGAAEKTGRLRASQFTILGDPVVSEVLQGSEEVRKANRKIVREQVEFDHLDVPFSLGHGQVVLGDSTINGPLLGARLNGKVDYNKQTVFLEGTYVPLYGLNSIPNSIPIIGEILSGGRTGDGLFGITFQVQGPMGRPLVVVNPLSVLTPGLFRQIWETAPQGQAVVPRADPRSRPPAAQSSSTAPQTQDTAQRATTGDAAAKTGAGRASSSGPQRVEPGSVAGGPRPDAVPARAPPPRERNSIQRPQEDGQ